MKQGYGVGVGNPKKELENFKPWSQSRIKQIVRVGVGSRSRKKLKTRIGVGRRSQKFKTFDPIFMFTSHDTIFWIYYLVLYISDVVCTLMNKKIMHNIFFEADSKAESWVGVEKIRPPEVDSRVWVKIKSNTGFRVGSWSWKNLKTEVQFGSRSRRDFPTPYHWYRERRRDNLLVHSI